MNTTTVTRIEAEREAGRGHVDRHQGFLRQPAARRAAQGHGADRPLHVRAQGHDPVPRREDAEVAALSRAARAAPLSERRGALHRLQAVRGGVPGAGHHDRIRAARRRHAPHDALRHRPDQVHLLRLLRGELPGRFDRRDPHPRVSRREARRPVLHEGDAARGWRPLREGRSPRRARPTRRIAERRVPDATSPQSRASRTIRSHTGTATNDH